MWNELQWNVLEFSSVFKKIWGRKDSSLSDCQLSCIYFLVIDKGQKFPVEKQEWNISPSSLLISIANTISHKQRERLTKIAPRGEGILFEVFLALPVAHVTFSSCCARVAQVAIKMDPQIAISFLDTADEFNNQFPKKLKYDC